MDELLQEKVEFYQKNGFVQFNDLLSEDELQELRAALDEVMQTRDQYAVNSSPKDGAYYRVLNQKVNTWRDHGGMCKFSFHPKFAEIALQLTGANGIRFFHDHALLKMPGDSKPTPWHQDLPYWPMNEPGALSIWIALDDVDEQNGCMMFVPSSHSIGKLSAIDLTNPQDIYEHARGTGVENRQPVIVRMKAGSCTFHNGLTFHYAFPNRSPKPRRAFAIIYMPDGTTYNGKHHLVTDNYGLEVNQPIQGGLFPLLAKRSN